MTAWNFHNNGTGPALTTVKDHGGRRPCDQSCWPFVYPCSMSAHCLGASPHFSVSHHGETRSDVNTRFMSSSRAPCTNNWRIQVQAPSSRTVCWKCTVINGGNLIRCMWENATFVEWSGAQLYLHHDPGWNGHSGSSPAVVYIALLVPRHRSLGTGGLKADTAPGEWKRVKEKGYTSYKAMYYLLPINQLR